MSEPALLALEDGTVFHGISVGAEGTTIGEVVFNTAMTGYQEILTDPSYCRQIITLTYPHIGNTATNTDDFESTQIYAAGLVVRDLPAVSSSWREEIGFPEFLKRGGLVAIAEIDTRKLTRIVREKGAQSGCIMTGDIDQAIALDHARGFPGLAGMDLAKIVTVPESYQWSMGRRWPRPGPATGNKVEKFHVVAFDFGIKRSILRLFVEYGCRVTVVPAQTTADEVLTMSPDGVFLSNGPGDPESCDYAIKAIESILQSCVPVLGICLGHQLLALASGAHTVKMKFGHHGANHPVANVDTGEVLITSQNHGFAVDEASLPDNLRPTHRSLFDNSLQGVERTDCAAIGFQGHPEASPGPHDLLPMFGKFIEMMQERNNG
ncbi:MAG: glutamine-hydrolyzing carbamoyl-phosphate synthase small subunit [Pseudomonadota bacterium]|nr:glutamine-hydrolyzing carbamoyl-phosphate synthase small subunit [Pseudomonadota bacterium]